MAGIVGPGGVATGDQIQNEEAQFATDVGKNTGVDPRVIFAWAQQEGAYAKNGTGGLNFLNLRPQAGDPYSSVSPGGFEQFSSLSNAETATERRIKEPFIWSYLGPVVAEKGTPAQEISAIGQSGWDRAHYGNPPGEKLLASYNAYYPGTAGQPSTSTDITAGGTSGTGSVTGSIPGYTDITGALSSIQSAFAFLFSVRFLEILGGGLLVLLGLWLLARQLGVSAPKPPGPAADVFESAAATGETRERAAAGRREGKRRAQGTSAVAQANQAGRQAEAATANL
jgi:hypothetical protein